MYVLNINTQTFLYFGPRVLGNRVAVRVGRFCETPWCEISDLFVDGKCTCTSFVRYHYHCCIIYCTRYQIPVYHSATTVGPKRGEGQSGRFQQARGWGEAVWRAWQQRHQSAQPDLIPSLRRIPFQWAEKSGSRRQQVRAMFIL